MIMTDAMLLEAVEAFLARTEMKPTRLGLESLGDGGLVKNIREGRSLSLRNAEKLVAFMEEFERKRPEPARAA
ncbi:hypothetical protein [Sphingomonas sp.]|uniref:hypothetical protein n=1 Tax=Sphingomonas sp. TaxID=28214 RepID=UPI0031DBC574